MNKVFIALSFLLLVQPITPSPVPFNLFADVITAAIDGTTSLATELTTSTIQNSANLLIAGLTATQNIINVIPKNIEASLIAFSDAVATGGNQLSATANNVVNIVNNLINNTALALNASLSVSASVDTSNLLVPITQTVSAIVDASTNLIKSLVSPAGNNLNQFTTLFSNLANIANNLLAPIANGSIPNVLVPILAPSAIGVTSIANMANAIIINFLNNTNPANLLSALINGIANLSSTAFPLSDVISNITQLPVTLIKHDLNVLQNTLSNLSKILNSLTTANNSMPSININLTDVMNSFAYTFNNLKTNPVDLLNAILDNTLDTSQLIPQFLNNIDLFSKLINSTVTQPLSSVFNNFSNVLNSIINGLHNVFQAAGSTVANLVNNLSNNLRDITSTLSNNFGNYFNSSLKVINDLTVAPALYIAKSAATKLLNGANQLAGNLTANLTSGLNTLLQSANIDASANINIIIQLSQGLNSNLSAALSSGLQSAANCVAQLQPAFQAFGNLAVDGIRLCINDEIANAQQTINNALGIVQGISSTATDLLNNLNNCTFSMVNSTIALTLSQRTDIRNCVAAVTSVINSNTLAIGIQSVLIEAKVAADISTAKERIAACIAARTASAAFRATILNQQLTTCLNA